MLYQLFSQSNPIISFIVCVSFVFAMIIALSSHEYAHGYVAYKNGDPTAKVLGRLTLNPLKHIDVLGLIFMLVMGFGWAKPVPINSQNFNNGKKSHIAVALAGIITNLILGIVFSLIFALFELFIPSFSNPTSMLIVFLNMFLYYSISLNFMFAFFNLLPIFPLDGFRLIEALSSPYNSYVVFMKRYSIIVILIAMVFGIITYYLNYTAGLLQIFLDKFWWMIFKWFGA